MVLRADFSMAKRMLEQEPSIVLLDVRSEEEYVAGHADGAVLLDVAKLDGDSARRAIPSLSTPVLVYCRSGYRSHKAALRLDALGYRAVFDLGSLAGWPYGMSYGLEP